ncbi:sigma-70 family RNA polymerase sigma factor [Gloeobacter morelensis MG652769]|uniref:Sigma-70 family RNA polymerase sigma factor n=2 Tax=Gloeobacter TaxID=33071 RepID=A0ABY3PTB7_9CYAN|nr:sigma-70 family RNA polymerase sigma factor [Gloeobacter morelensis MG652769]
MDAETPAPAPQPPEHLSAEITQLLAGWHKGDRRAIAELTPILYSQLRMLARRHLYRERANHTLQPTALVHEAYFRLVEQTRVHWENRTQFFSVASLLMRRVLVDYARAQGAIKRQAGTQKLALDEAVHVPSQGRPVDWLALDEALDELARIEPEYKRVVELRYFMGLTIEEVATVMEISPATVKRYWAQARTWLKQQLVD